MCVCVDQLVTLFEASLTVYWLKSTWYLHTWLIYFSCVFFFSSYAGYEKYNSMRADPTLCFLERVGMPDAKAIAAEQRGSDMMADGVEG